MQSPDKKIIKDFPSGDNFVSINCPLAAELESSDPYVRDTAKLKLLMVDAAREIRSSLSRQDSLDVGRIEEKSNSKQSSDETIAVFQKNLFNDNLIHKATVVTLAKVLREEIDTLKDSSQSSAIAYEEKIQQITAIKQQSDVKLVAAQETIASLERMLSQSIQDEDETDGPIVATSSAVVEVDSVNVTKPAVEHSTDSISHSTEPSNSSDASPSTTSSTASSANQENNASIAKTDHMTSSAVTRVEPSSSSTSKESAGNVIVSNLGKILHERSDLVKQVNRLKQMHESKMEEESKVSLHHEAVLNSLKAELTTANLLQAKTIDEHRIEMDAIRAEFQSQKLDLLQQIDSLTSKINQLTSDMDTHNQKLIDGELSSKNDVEQLQSSVILLEDQNRQCQVKLDAAEAEIAQHLQERSALQERLNLSVSEPVRVEADPVVKVEPEPPSKGKMTDLIGALVALQETAVSLSASLTRARQSEEKMKTDHELELENVKRLAISSASNELEVTKRELVQTNSSLVDAKKEQKDAVDAMRGMDIELQSVDSKFREVSFERDSLKAEVDSSNSHILNLTQLLSLAETTLTSTSDSSHSNLNDKSSLFQLWKALETARSDNGKIRTDYRELLKRASTREHRALVINVSQEAPEAKDEKTPRKGGPGRTIHRKLRSSSNVLSLLSSDNFEVTPISTIESENTIADTPTSHQSTPKQTVPDSQPTIPLISLPPSSSISQSDHDSIKSDLEQKLSTAKEEKTSLTSECASLRQQLADKHNEITGLHEHSTLLRNTIDNDRQHFVTANEAYRQSVTKIMQDRHEEEELAREELLNEMEALKDRESRLKQQMKRMVMNDEDGEESTKQVPSAEADLLKMTISEMQIELDTSKNENVQYVDELGQLAVSLQEMQETNDGLTSKIAELETLLSAQIQIAATSRTVVVNDPEPVVTKEVEEDDDDLTVDDNDVASADDDVERTSQTRDEESAKFAMINAENEELRAELKKLRKSVESHGSSSSNAAGTAPSPRASAQVKPVSVSAPTKKKSVAKKGFSIR